MSIYRRSRVDTLAPRESASWLVVRNEISRVVTYLAIPARADLRKIMKQASECIRAPAQIEDFDPRQSRFFFRTPCARYSLAVQFAPSINPLADWALPREALSIEACLAEAIAPGGEDSAAPGPPRDSAPRDPDTR